MSRAARLIVGASARRRSRRARVGVSPGCPTSATTHERYGELVAQRAVPERAATNAVVVTALRLPRLRHARARSSSCSSAVIGVRGPAAQPQRDERRGRARPRAATERAREASLAALRWARRSSAPIAVLGAYIVAHGAPHARAAASRAASCWRPRSLLVFVAGEYVRCCAACASRRAGRDRRGARARPASSLLGLGGLSPRGAFLRTSCRQGTPASLLSGGTIPLLERRGRARGGRRRSLMVLAEFLDQRAAAPTRAT